MCIGIAALIIISGMGFVFYFSAHWFPGLIIGIICIISIPVIIAIARQQEKEHISLLHFQAEEQAKEEKRRSQIVKCSNCHREMTLGLFLNHGCPVCGTDLYIR